MRSRTAIIAAVLFGLSIALVVLALTVLPFGGSERAGAPLDTMSREELEEERIRQEIRNLESERSLLRVLPSYAAIGTAIAGLLGFLGTMRAQSRERESESIRRFDENFNNVVTNLGSDRPAAQATAAVSLMTFLRPEYRSFHDQVFLVTLAALKTPQQPEVNRLLVQTLGTALKLIGSPARSEEDRIPLDFSRTHLDRVDLQGLDLTGVDIAFATMEHAVLRGATLSRARGIGVHLDEAVLSRANLREARLNESFCTETYFHDARMDPCWLEGADLRKAKFQGAELQSAHLERAKLQGARFEGADLNDTYFCGATLDDSALASIAKANNWKRAHFDERDRGRLAELTGAMPGGGCPEPQRVQEAPAATGPDDEAED